MCINLKSILVSVTEGCHVGCAHCGFIGSQREREIDDNDLCSWVSQICEYKIPLVIFTGGEPFERLELLESAVAVCRERNTPSAVFTSSYWATGFDQAKSILSRLSGLHRLYLSSDTYHQKRIPFEYVYNAIEAADHLGVSELTVCITYATEQDRLMVRNAYEKYGDRIRFYEERVIPTPYIQKQIRSQDSLRGISPDDYEAICWIDTPIINPNGDLFACHVGKVGAHGSFEDIPYWLGNLKNGSFRELMNSAQERLEYQFLRCCGPKGVANLFKEYPWLKSGENQAFTGRCDMCFSLLSTEKGRAALNDYVQRKDVVDQINIGRFVRHGEPPVETNS